MIVLWIGLALLGLISGWCIGTFNGFVRLRTQSDEAWSGIGVQLKRRYDLIPNLVQTVKGYAQHEKGVFEKVSQARAFAIGAQGPKTQAAAEDALGASLKSLLAVAEAYPELKANQNFADLQKSLNEVEDQLQYARRFYNAVVRNLNIRCGSFPSVLIAQAFNFSKKEFFEIGDPEKQNVQVAF